MIKDHIQTDLKTAMLTKDSFTVTALRGVKSAILDAEIAAGLRDTGLPHDDVVRLLQKEAKKRQESADLYLQGGAQERADNELREKQIIEQYLPKQLNEAEVKLLVEAVTAEQGGVTQQTMGSTIAAVRTRAGGAADGALIAKLVRERIK